MKKIITVCLLVALSSVSCTDAEKSQFTSLGSSGHIKCYSGGQLIYEGDSTGKIASEDQSDGWFFRDKRTDKLVRVSGDCLIEN